MRTFLISIIKLTIYLGLLFVTSCANPGMQSYSANTNALLDASKAPREGWATDPHLSYRLFSYYPTNYYNTGFYTGPYGYGGIYYH